MTTRREQAEGFLQEAVYQSRSEQSSALLQGSGSCGLGEKAIVALDLSERGQELFATLWPNGLNEQQTARVRELLTAWVERQDGLDRKRNHFMKDFRHKHGFDRTQYTEEQAADWRTGLDRVNDEVAQERGSVADELLAATSDADSPAEA